MNQLLVFGLQINIKKLKLIKIEFKMLNLITLKLITFKHYRYIIASATLYLRGWPTDQQHQKWNKRIFIFHTFIFIAGTNTYLFWVKLNMRGPSMKPWTKKTKCWNFWELQRKCNYNWRNTKLLEWKILVWLVFFYFELSVIKVKLLSIWYIWYDVEVQLKHCILYLREKWYIRVYWKWKKKNIIGISNNKFNRL